MKCLACWREAERMAKRGGTKQAAMHPVTKRIYMQYHIGMEAQEQTCSHGTHITDRPNRRHRNGKAITLKIAS